MKNIIIGCLLAALVWVSSSVADPLKFGVVYSYPPFVFPDAHGKVYGFDIDLVNALCRDLKVRCNFIPMPLDETFKSLRANQIDAIISAISITQARQEIFDFTPRGIIKRLDLKRPIYRPTAAYGHFGRKAGESFTWERVDSAEALQNAVLHSTLQRS